MSEFGERLKELMTEKGLSSIDLEKATGISNSRVSEWVRYDVSPYLGSLLKLSDFFNVSIDYLIGLSEEKSFRKARGQLLFCNRLETLMKENGISGYKLAKKAGVDRSVLTRWKNGALPTMYSLVALARLFSCSIEYLIGRED